MIRLIVVFLILACSQAQATIARVQSKTATTAAVNGSTLTITLTSAATVGNTLLVGIVTGDVSITALFGASSQAYMGTVRNSTNGMRTTLCYIPVVESGQTNIVITSTSAVNAIVAIAVEYSGLNIKPDIMPLTAFNTSASTTSTTGTLAATNVSNELIVAVFGTRGAYSSEQTGWLTGLTNSFSSPTGAGGFQTSSSTNVANADRAVAFAERIVTSTGTYSTAGTQPSNHWQNVIASFREVLSQYSSTSGN